MVLFSEVPSDRHVGGEIRTTTGCSDLGRQDPTRLHDEKESRVVGLLEPRMRLVTEVGNEAGAEWGASLELLAHH